MPEPISTLSPPAGLMSQAGFARDLGADQRSFAAILGRDWQAPGAPAQTPEQRARSTAEQYVAIALVQPVLKQLRDPNPAVPPFAPFAPTQAERQFRALMDAELAQRLVHAQRFPLVDRIAGDLMARAGLTPAPSPTAGDEPVVPLR